MTHTNTSAVFRADYSINSVTTSDSGTYTCTVTNPIGSDSETITVVVVTGELILSRLTVVNREAKKAQSTHTQAKNATTTVSHLHDGTVSQFSKIMLCF